MERLKASWLPDFTKKIDMLEAAKLFKKAIDKHCRASAQDPNWETNMVTAREQHGGDYSDKIICVNATPSKLQIPGFETLSPVILQPPQESVTPRRVMNGNTNIP